MNQSEQKFYTIEDVRRRLIDVYGKIPKGNLQAYEFLRGEMELVGRCELPYEEMLNRHKLISEVLGFPFSPEGGLAGRDVREF